MNKKDIPNLLLSIFVCHSAGIIGSFFTAPAIRTWYATLQKPWFTPPNWIFAPVWLTLYTLMGVSLFMVLSNKRAMYIFGSQLGLNAFWSFAFFGLQSPLLGLIVLIALMAVLAFTIYEFWKISVNAAYLLVPYFAWVCIATALNVGVFILN